MLISFKAFPKICRAFTSLLSLNLFTISIQATRLPNGPAELFLEMGLPHPVPFSWNSLLPTLPIETVDILKSQVTLYLFSKLLDAISPFCILNNV